MGSWSETCALSHMPITCGDEVVYLLITQSTYDRIDGVYANDFWGLRSCPIFGKYDDYGEIAVAKGEEIFIDTLVDQFSSDLVCIPQDEHSKILDTPVVNVQNCNFSNINSWLHDIGLKVWVEGPFSKEQNIKAKISRILIRREVWDIFVNETLSSMKEDRFFIKTNAFDDCKDFQDKVWENRNSGKHFFEIFESRENMFASFLNSPAAVVPTRNSYLALLRNMQGQILNNKEKTDDTDKANFYLFAERTWEQYLVGQATSSHRMNWAPTTGSGSQNENFGGDCKMFLEFAKIAYRKFEERVKECVEWDFESAYELQEKLSELKEDFKENP